MKSTKKPAASCKVPVGSPPTKAEYNALRKQINAVIKTATKAVAVTGVSIPYPHPMPVYGGKCWQQSYNEAKAYQAAAKALAAYNQAMYAYNVAWAATQACLTGYFA